MTPPRSFSTPASSSNSSGSRLGRLATTTTRASLNSQSRTPISRNRSARSYTPGPSTSRATRSNSHGHSHGHRHRYMDPGRSHTSPSPPSSTLHDPTPPHASLEMHIRDIALQAAKDVKTQGGSSFLFASKAYGEILEQALMHLGDELIEVATAEFLSKEPDPQPQTCVMLHGHGRAHALSVSSSESQSPFIDGNNSNDDANSPCRLGFFPRRFTHTLSREIEGYGRWMETNGEFLVFASRGDSKEIKFYEQELKVRRVSVGARWDPVVNDVSPIPFPVSAERRAQGQVEVEDAVEGDVSGWDRGRWYGVDSSCGLAPSGQTSGFGIGFSLGFSHETLQAGGINVEEGMSQEEKQEIADIRWDDEKDRLTRLLIDQFEVVHAKNRAQVRSETGIPIEIRSEIARNGAVPNVDIDAEGQEKDDLKWERTGPSQAAIEQQRGAGTGTGAEEVNSTTTAMTDLFKRHASRMAESILADSGFVISADDSERLWYPVKYSGEMKVTTLDHHERSNHEQDSEQLGGGIEITRTGAAFMTVRAEISLMWAFGNQWRTASGVIAESRFKYRGSKEPGSASASGSESGSGSGDDEQSREEVFRMQRKADKHWQELELVKRNLLKGLEDWRTSEFS